MLINETGLGERVIGLAIDVHPTLFDGERHLASEWYIEVKAVERLMPIHDAQLLAYLKLSGCTAGLLMNSIPLCYEMGSRGWFCNAIFVSFVPSWCSLMLPPIHPRH